jgi:hypothetical protein
MIIRPYLLRAAFVFGKKSPCRKSAGAFWAADRVGGRAAQSSDDVVEEEDLSPEDPAEESSLLDELELAFCFLPA